MTDAQEQAVNELNRQLDALINRFVAHNLTAEVDADATLLFLMGANKLIKQAEKIYSKLDDGSIPAEALHAVQEKWSQVYVKKILKSCDLIEHYIGLSDLNRIKVLCNIVQKVYQDHCKIFPDIFYAHLNTRWNSICDSYRERLEEDVRLNEWHPMALISEQQQCYLHIIKQLENLEILLDSVFDKTSFLEKSRLIPDITSQKKEVERLLASLIESCYRIRLNNRWLHMEHKRLGVFLHLLMSLITQKGSLRAIKQFYRAFELACREMRTKWPLNDFTPAIQTE
ncbi:MAG: hypothetical protein KAT71_07065, partial [Gammaproteobacteria bacterium]|nr:hypothetical protein [Gammaproteobacteria bacterium]